MRKVTLKALLLSVISLIIFASWLSQTANPQTGRGKTVLASETFTGKIVGVSDGDIISVMRGGRAVKVRLHGIDCPEAGQPYSKRAKRFTSDLAYGNEGSTRGKVEKQKAKVLESHFVRLIKK